MMAGNGSHVRTQDVTAETIATRTMFADQRDQRPIHAPNDVFHRRAVYLHDTLLLLNIIGYGGRCRTENQTCSTTVEDLVRLDWQLDGIGEVATFDELIIPIAQKGGERGEVVSDKR